MLLTFLLFGPLLPSVGVDGDGLSLPKGIFRHSPSSGLRRFRRLGEKRSAPDMLHKPDVPSSVAPEEAPPLAAGKAPATNGVEGVVFDTPTDPAFPTLVPERAPVIAPLREDAGSGTGKVPYLDSAPAPPAREPERSSEDVQEQEPPRGMIRERTYPAPPLSTRDDFRADKEAGGGGGGGGGKKVAAPNDNGEFRVKVGVREKVKTGAAEEDEERREPAPVLDVVPHAVAKRKYETRLEAIASGRKGFNPENIEVLSLDKPRAFLFHEFLTDEECDHLVKVAQAGLSQSGVVDTETGGSSISNIRTSMGAFIPRGMDDIIRGIEQRIAEWTMIPEDHGEAIQVLRYEKSQEYRAHYDYFFHKQGEMNNRIATALLYLSEVEEGGETVFPNTAVPKGRTGQWSECGNMGLAVKPEKRAVLLFWGMKTGGELDGGSSHAGCPVIKGVKWTATKWMHVGPANQYDAQQKVWKEPRPKPRPGCEDKEEKCYTWGEQGECHRNTAFMEASCRLTCGLC